MFMFYIQTNMFALMEILYAPKFSSIVDLQQICIFLSVGNTFSKKM